MTAIRAATEGPRDRPPGAGAAPGRDNDPPRAQRRRGDRTSRSLKFYGSLSRMPSAFPRVASEITSPKASAQRFARWGEFVGSSRWMLAPKPSRDDDDLAAGQGDLGVVLDAIADDMNRVSSAVRTQIVASFAAQISQASHQAQPSQRGAIIAGLIAARASALTITSREAANELRGRIEQAKKSAGKPKPKVRRNKKPDRPAPGS